jgi:hypothetical protein
MAQLKSTSVTGNLSVTGNTVASKVVADSIFSNQILLSDGTTTSHDQITANILNAQTQADNAIINAATAQSTANAAVSDAALADSKAVDAQIAADNADTKAENAHNYARAVYGDIDDEAVEYTVIGNAAAINALAGTHTQNV